MKAFATLGNKGPQASTTPTSGAIQIMTIHGAKGLQAPVVIVTGLFEAGRRSSSIEAQNNVLITPDVIAGRIQPWKSKDKPEDALWMLAEQMNKAQNQAELRRQFYVALTRVKDRLIFVGSPNAPCSIGENSMIAMKINSKGNNMGDLMMDGFRYMGVQSGSEQVWNLDDDVHGNVSTNTVNRNWNSTQFLFSMQVDSWTIRFNNYACIITLIASRHRRQLAVSQLVGHRRATLCIG